MPSAHPAELALIDRIRQLTPTRTPAIRLGIGDDCAILRLPPGHELLLTTDLSLEGRHFRRDWHSPQSAGHRCLARGLSDIAAMGGKPLAAFLSIALPPGFDPLWLDQFLSGFHTLANQFSVQLAGGDTAQAPGEHILADIVLTGSAPAGRALRRSGARPGDLLYVSGTLGGASAELTRLAAGEPCPTESDPFVVSPQSFPRPRLALGQALLRRKLASACMDLSDGLSTDLSHLCEASAVAAELDLARLPLALLPDGTHTSEYQALHGGEDYELLFTTRPAIRLPRHLAGTPLTRIGRIVERTAHAPLVSTLAPDGTRRPLQPGGWQHFVSPS